MNFLINIIDWFLNMSLIDKGFVIACIAIIIFIIIWAIAGLILRKKNNKKVLNTSNDIISSETKNNDNINKNNNLEESNIENDTLSDDEEEIDIIEIDEDTNSTETEDEIDIIENIEEDENIESQELNEEQNDDANNNLNEDEIVESQETNEEQKDDSANNLVVEEEIVITTEDDSTKTVEESNNESEMEHDNTITESSKENITKEDNTNEENITTIENKVEDDKSVKKGRSYNGKYEIYQVDDGYAYHLKASNGEILVVSETFKTKDGVYKAIDVVKKNISTGTTKVSADKRGKFKFRLISKNYRVLVISSNYSTEKGAYRALESFKKFALKADIIEKEYNDSDLKLATPIEILSREDKQGGKFFVEKYEDEYSWDLKASNGQILCQADGYTTKSGCLYSIEKFKKNVEQGVFKCVKDKAGRYCYKLYTPAGRVCAVGESYTTKQSAESAANSVVAFYKLAEIKDELAK